MINDSRKNQYIFDNSNYFLESNQTVNGLLGLKVFFRKSIVFCRREESLFKNHFRLKKDRSTIMSEIRYSTVQMRAFNFYTLLKPFHHLFRETKLFEPPWVNQNSSPINSLENLNGPVNQPLPTIAAVPYKMRQNTLILKQVYQILRFLFTNKSDLDANST